MKRKIVCFGPGPVFKGGISDYNTSLALALGKRKDTQVYIVSWTQQYPFIIPRDFLDRKSKKNILEGTDIALKYITNYNNPFSWYKTYRFILKLQPDIVVFQWAIALQGLPMGYIARKLAKHCNIEVVFDLHVVRQKESGSIDKFFTRFGLKYAKTFIAHSYQTVDQLKQLFPKENFYVNETGERKKDMRNVIKLYHPVYNIFRPDPNLDVDAVKCELNLKKHVFLFFGFIRKYKGLHNVIKAFSKVCKERDDVSLLIVGESFWNTLNKKKLGTKLKILFFDIGRKIFLNKADNEKNYNPLALTEESDIADSVVVINRFVANEEVHKYFQTADCIVNYYITATPSGVESIAYNFNLPILATRVGHFPETVKEGVNGYLAEADHIDDMAAKMLYFLSHPIQRSHVTTIARSMSWENYASAILGCRKLNT